MGIAGQVSRAVLSRYSHVRMEAKRRTLDEIAVPCARQTRGTGAPNEDPAPQSGGRRPCSARPADRRRSAIL